MIKQSLLKKFVKEKECRTSSEAIEYLERTLKLIIKKQLGVRVLANGVSDYTVADCSDPEGGPPEKAYLECRV